MDEETGVNSVLEPTRNCWRIEKAARVALIVGGEAYFRTVRQALLSAKRHVVILAWDVHSEILLDRDEKDPEDGFPRKLGPFLNELLEQRPDLQIHLLVWDFSMIYAAEREWRIFSDSFRNPHPRLHLQFDDQLPTGASHHQKIVVIDDALAFSGGLDLSTWRWDTAKHHLHDERRTDPKGKPYAPYHDLQLAVNGPAASALGDLCADRWERATGNSLPRSESAPETDRWDSSLNAFLENVEIGIARTYAAFEPWPEVQEIERLHLDLIAVAKEYLYFENQFFSSRRLTEAIAERLRESDGPEIIVVMTQGTGWLEQSTMGLLQNRLFEILSEADVHSRLRLLSPQVVDEAGEESTHVYVHAKLILIDDRILKVGSSNLSNRSMRVDSEVDLVIERATKDPAIRARLIELLAIHFAEDLDTIENRLASKGSLAKTIDSLLTDTGHSLRPLSFGCDSDLQRHLADSQLLDPDEPMDPDYWIRNLIPQQERPPILRRFAQLSALIAFAMLLGFLVKGGWGSTFDQETISAELERFQSHPWTGPVLMVTFLVAGLVGLPLNLILVAATIFLGPWIAIGYGYVGSHLAALAGFGLGKRFGKPLLRRWDAERIEPLRDKLGDSSILTMALIRIVPIAPFIVVNIVAGFSHLRMKTFHLGTLLGMAPGMTGVALLTHQLNTIINQPSWNSVLGFLCLLLLVGGAIFFIGRALSRRSHSKHG